MNNDNFYNRAEKKLEELKLECETPDKTEEFLDELHSIMLVHFNNKNKIV